MRNAPNNNIDPRRGRKHVRNKPEVKEFKERNKRRERGQSCPREKVRVERGKREKKEWDWGVKESFLGLKNQRILSKILLNFFKFFIMFK